MRDCTFNPSQNRTSAVNAFGSQLTPVTLWARQAGLAVRHRMIARTAGHRNQVPNLTRVRQRVLSQVEVVRRPTEPGDLTRPTQPANDCNQRLATKGLSTPPDFIASPLHHLVRLSASPSPPMLLALSLPPLLKTFWNYEILSDAAIRLRNQFQRLDQQNLDIFLLDQSRERLGDIFLRLGSESGPLRVARAWRWPRSPGSRER